MKDEKLNELGYSVPIFRAVEAAGGPLAVAYHMGMKSPQAVDYWHRRRNIPAAKIHRLCELGGFKVKPAEILEEVAKYQAEKVAA